MNRQDMLPLKSGSRYNELRMEGKHLDGVIQVQDVEFKIHKIILSGCSPFFHSYINLWSTEDRRVFTVSGLSPEMMELIIEFAYTGSVAVTEDNAQELMLAADMLGITDVVQTCSEFLSEHLSLNNCVTIWQFTKVCFSVELQREAYSFIIEHFEELVLHQQFLQLSEQELGDILDQDELNVKNEKIVYEAVLRWITYMPAERSGLIAMLLSKVRLAQTTVEYVSTTVMSNELVKHNQECRQLVRRTIRVVEKISTTPLLSDTYYHLTRPRLPHAILLAIGGFIGRDMTNIIEAYDVRADSWINVTNMNRRCTSHGVAFLNGSVYCVGGYDGFKCLNNVSRFDLSTRTWHDVAPMYSPRCSGSVTVLNGCIYAMGGHDRHTHHRSAECYTPETNQWKRIAPMHEKRTEASCTVLHDKIYICGGFSDEYLQSAECYDPIANQWTMIMPMNTIRSGLGVIAYADQVFAVGGYNGQRCLKTAEAYNPCTNTWTSVSSMNRPRSYFGIEVIDGRLFAVGGTNNNTSIASTEYYDAATDEWSDACNMGYCRSKMSCCVISRLPSLTEYTFPRVAEISYTCEEDDDDHDSE